jgi:hypothetical protein
MKASEFDRKFDDAESVLDTLDLASARKSNLDQRKVNVDFPTWMIEALDKAARRRGVTRQSVIKMWLAERLEREAAAAKIG